MRLKANDLFHLCQHAISAARQAGKIISEHSRQNVSVKIKNAGSNKASQVVTEVDHLCQAIILQTLLPTCKSFDLALLAEENPDDLTRIDKDFFWCIDPLDGTLPFIESTPGYAVSIALVARDGTSHIGVIYDPVEQTLYHVIRGQGAFRNGQRWSAKKSCAATNHQSLTFITDRSFSKNPLFPKIRTELINIASTLGYKNLNIIMQGGAAMNACWVLEKAPACYFKYPKPEEGGGSLWDYAATACLFLEMGAVASDIYGNPLELNRSDSTFMNHRGVLFSSDHDLAGRIQDLYNKLLVS